MARTDTSRSQGQPMSRQPHAPQPPQPAHRPGHGGLRRLFLDLLVGIPMSAGIVWIFLAYLGLV
jgi:hypothetical protein